MGGDRPLVEVGDVLDLVPGNYLDGIELGNTLHTYGEQTWRARVKHIPTPKPTLGAPRWVSLIVTEDRSEPPYGPDRIVAVKVSSLPGYRPPVTDLPERIKA